MTIWRTPPGLPVALAPRAPPRISCSLGRTRAAFLSVPRSWSRMRFTGILAAPAGARSHLGRALVILPIGGKRSLAQLLGRTAKVVRGGAARPAVLRLNASVHLFPVDLDLRRRVDAQLDLTRAHFQHRDLDLVSDADHFSQLPCQDQHEPCLPG